MMSDRRSLTRRRFVTETGTMIGAIAAGWRPGRSLAATDARPHADMARLRQDVVHAPPRVALHRAEVFTRVFQRAEDQPWMVRKALALREYFETVPLFIREHDGLAGSISELPGAMPVMVELAIGENDIYLSERPDRRGYLQGQVPESIRDYWKNRNLWGHYRGEILGQPPVATHDALPAACPHYKLLSNQGHLSPSFEALLRDGLDGLLARVRARRQNAADPLQLEFLTAAEQTLEGLAAWTHRYGEFLAAHAARCGDAERAAELREMARICEHVAHYPPQSFREALQLVWLAYQAIHIEGHGYSCTPDRLDQLLWPWYQADRRTGRLDDATVVRLVENFVLKMYDNTYWGSEHHLTQGFVVGGSTPDGRDLTNPLSRLMLEGATNLRLPEPLIWLRYHPRIDQDLFDYALTRLVDSTCFPMLWNDPIVAAGLIELGIARDDAFNYVPVGCNELAIPGRMYFNPGANVNYLTALEAALTGGRGYRGQWQWRDIAPPVAELTSFDRFAEAVGAYMRAEIGQSYDREMQLLQAQMQRGQTPLTSCFFDGCVEQARDLTQGTEYNILSCGGIAFANAVDCFAAIREVVFRQRAASLEELAHACAENFQGQERLRAKLLAAPKQGNDDPRLDDLIRLTERLRDEPMWEICSDPRDGSKFGNSHVVRSGAVTMGRHTPATPDGRLAGTPVANSVAVSAGCERGGPTATLNSVRKLNAVRSWQCAYQVNIRFHSGMLVDDVQRAKLRALLTAYFAGGGQQLQINVVSTETLRAAQQDPDQFRDLVVRVAGFSEFFVNLTPDMQEEIIARTEHR
jgi:pyruvate-formate lyase